MTANTDLDPSCDYTQTLYGSNDTSWLALFNASYPTFNSSGYSLNATYSTNITNLDNSTLTPAPTPTPDNPSNSTISNSTGVFPSAPSFNVSDLDSHLYFAPNGSVYCSITGLWYPANDTSWESLLNGTYPGFNVTAYAGPGYSLNSTLGNLTNVNASLPTTTSSAVDTPSPAPAPVDNSSIAANSSGIYPSYNGSTFNISALVNSSSDHLVFYPNGSVWCDYTQQRE